MNERRADAASGDDLSMKCECECHRAECGGSFTVTMNAYEEVRADGRHFLVAPEHQSAEEEVVTTTAAYWVIEKTGDQGRIAASLDPR
jgi:hypothetical protein